MSNTIKVMLVLTICIFAMAAFAQNQLGPSTTQTPTYNNGAPGTTAGVDKWGTTPSGATSIGNDNGFAFTAGQQFNSKWQLINGNHDLTSNATKVATWQNLDGTARTVAASRICSFCHTAHDNESQFVDRTFLWAHAVPVSFAAYTSPTLQSAPNTTQTSQSAQCLGCHDGTIAVSSGSYGTPPVDGTTGDSANYLIGGVALTDKGRLLDSTGLVVPLSRTHPVSFTYDATLAAKHQMRVPANANSIDGYGIVPLFNGNMECATCHDPHIKSGIMRRNFPTGASQDAGTGSFCMYCHL